MNTEGELWFDIEKKLFHQSQQLVSELPRRDLIGVEKKKRGNTEWL